MLKLDDQWITINFRECIQFANTAPPMVDYVLRRLKISLDEFNLINWTSIGKIRASHPINRAIQTSKMMYRWLPVGHNWKKCNLPSDKCPCCGDPDETFEHLLGCSNEQMESTRQQVYQQMQESMQKAEIPLYFTTAFLQVIKAGIGVAPLPNSFQTPTIQAALDN